MRRLSDSLIILDTSSCSPTLKHSIIRTAAWIEQRVLVSRWGPATDAGTAHGHVSSQANSAASKLLASANHAHYILSKHQSMMHWSSTSTDKTAWSANPSSNCLQGGSIVVTFTGLCVTSTCMHVGRLNRRQLRQTTGFWQHWKCSLMLSELFTSPFGVFNDLIVLFFLSLEIGGGEDSS